MSRPTTPTSEFFSNFEGFLKKFKLTTENDKDQEILTLANLDSGRIRKFIVKKVDERSLFGRRNSQKSTKDENENKSKKSRKDAQNKEKNQSSPQADYKRRFSSSSLTSLKSTCSLKRFSSSKSLSSNKSSSTSKKKKKKSLSGNKKYKIGCVSSSDSEVEDVFRSYGNEIMAVNDRGDETTNSGYENQGLVNDDLGVDSAQLNKENSRINMEMKKVEGEDEDISDIPSSLESSPSSIPRFNLKMSPVPRRNRRKNVDPSNSPVSFRSGYQSNRSSISSVRKGILKKTNSCTTINMEMANLSRPETPTENGIHHKSTESLEDTHSNHNGDTTRFARTKDNPHLHHQRSFNRVKFILDSGRPDNITGDYDDIKMEKNDKSDRNDKMKSGGKHIAGLSQSGKKCLGFSAGLLLLTMAVILGSFFGSRKTGLPPKALPNAVSNFNEHIASALEGKFKILNENFAISLYDYKSADFKKISQSLEDVMIKAIFVDAHVNQVNSTIKLKMVKYEKGSIISVFRTKWEGPPSLKLPELRKRILKHLNKYGAFGEYKVDKSSFSISELRDLCVGNPQSCSHICFLNDETLRFGCTCPDNLILINNTHCISPELTTTTAKNPVFIPGIVNKVLKISNAELFAVNQQAKGQIPVSSTEKTSSSTQVTKKEVQQTTPKDEIAPITDKPSTHATTVQTKVDDKKPESTNVTVVALENQVIHTDKNAIGDAKTTSLLPEKEDLMTDKTSLIDDAENSLVTTTIMNEVSLNIQTISPIEIVPNIEDDKVKKENKVTNQLTDEVEKPLSASEVTIKVTDAETSTEGYAKINTTMKNESHISSELSGGEDRKKETTSIPVIHIVRNVTISKDDIIGTINETNMILKNISWSSNITHMTKTDIDQNINPPLNTSLDRDTYAYSENATANEINIVSLENPDKFSNESTLRNVSKVDNQSSNKNETVQSDSSDADHKIPINETKLTELGADLHSYKIQNKTDLKPIDSNDDSHRGIINNAINATTTRNEIPVQINTISTVILHSNHSHDLTSHHTNESNENTIVKPEINILLSQDKINDFHSNLSSSTSTHTTPMPESISDANRNPSPSSDIENKTSISEQKIHEPTKMDDKNEANNTLTKTDDNLILDKEEVNAKLSPALSNTENEINESDTITSPSKPILQSTLSSSSLGDSEENATKSSMPITQSTPSKSYTDNVSNVTKGITRKDVVTVQGIPLKIDATTIKPVITSLNSTNNDSHTNDTSFHFIDNKSNSSINIGLLSNISHDLSIAVSPSVEDKTSTQNVNKTTLGDKQELPSSSQDGSVNLKSPTEEIVHLNSSKSSSSDFICSKGEFQCSDGGCVAGEQRCDSVFDCSDQSDENECVQNKCLDNYQCRWSGDCLSKSYVCDGIKHCTDGDDEEGCDTWRCSEEEFPCSVGSASTCIPLSSKCDGYPDCFNHTDELNCTSECPKDSFLCPEGSCIPNLWRCDGASDCLHGEDETDCDCEGLDQSACSVGGCVPTFKVCDGLRQCPDGSDEWGCIKIHNGTKELQVKSSGSLWSAVCGNKWTSKWTDLVCEQLGFGVSLSTEVRRVEESALRPRVKLSPDAPEVSRIGTAPLQYFLTPGECPTDPLVHVSCKPQECGNWNQSRVEFGLRNEGAEGAVWPSLGILIQPEINPEDAQVSPFDSSCAASVITPSWILTSYSCLASKKDGFKAEKWAFLIGEASPKARKGLTQLKYGKQLVVYPGAKRKNKIWEGDATLLRLQTSLVFGPSVRPICLSESPIKSHDNCVIASWKASKTQGESGKDKSQSQWIQNLPIPNLTINTCNTSYYPGLLTRGHSCASFLQEKGSPCTGNEGSALMCRSERGMWQLNGLLSHTGNCACFNLPSVFTDLSVVNSWLLSTIGRPSPPQRIKKSLLSTTTSTTTITSTTTTPPPPPSTTTTSTIKSTTSSHGNNAGTSPLSSANAEESRRGDASSTSSSPTDLERTREPKWSFEPSSTSAGEERPERTRGGEPEGANQLPPS